MRTQTLAQDRLAADAPGRTSSQSAFVAVLQAATRGILGAFATKVFSAQSSRDNWDRLRPRPLRHQSDVKLQIELLYELLDAHTDTAELADALGPRAAWQTHLEYLQALQRKARVLLTHLTMDGGA